MKVTILPPPPNSKTIKANPIKIEAPIDAAKAAHWAYLYDVDETTIKMLRFKGGWQELPTQLVSSDGTYFYYVATSQGFSIFAVTGEFRAKRPAPKPVPPAPYALPTEFVVPFEFFATLSMAGAIAGFVIYYSLMRPSKYYTLLKKIERAVVASRRRRV